MQRKQATVGNLAAANLALIAASQTPGAGALLTLTGSQPDTTRRIGFAAGSEAAPRTLLVTGTGWEGFSQSETVTIPASTAGTYITALDYATVTSIKNTGGAFTAALTAGTFAGGALGVGTGPAQSSAWIALDPWQLGPTALQTDVAGTINLTVQQTLDDPNGDGNLNPNAPTPPTPAQVTWINHPDANLVGFTASVQGNYAYPPIFAKLSVNSYTAGAGNNATLAVVQTGSPVQPIA